MHAGAVFDALCGRSAGHRRLAHRDAQTRSGEAGKGCDLFRIAGAAMITSVLDAKLTGSLSVRSALTTVSI